MEFSNVARPAFSLRTASTTWPSRPSTCTDTLYPCALQASIVARTIVVAMASDISLRARSWAFAEPTRPQASAEATETPAMRNAVLDMGMHLPDESRCSRGMLAIIGYCVGFALAFAGRITNPLLCRGAEMARAGSRRRPARAISRQSPLVVRHIAVIGAWVAVVV